MKTQKNFFLLGLLTFVAIIATGCPHKTEPTPTPTPAVPTITMKTGREINELLIGVKLNASSKATIFKLSATPAPDGSTTVTLSADGSGIECVAWFDDSATTIYYYAKGYTDEGKKIPLLNCSGMFSGCTSLKGIVISGFDTSAATSFARMFSGCNNLITLMGLDTLNTSSATNFYRMFYSCSAMDEIDIRSFDASKVENIDQMFYDCSNLVTIYAKFGTDWSSIGVGGVVFRNCTNLKGSAGTVYDSTKINSAYARIDNGTSAPGYFTGRN